MSEIDLGGLGKEELMALRKRIDERLGEVEREGRAKAIEAVKVVTAEHGFTVQALFGQPERGGRKGSGQAAAKRGQSPARFANPQDPSQTWSGRGRRPEWLGRALEAGGNLDDFKAQ